MEREAVRIGDLTLRPGVELARGGRTLPIGGRALDLLSVLASAGGAVVTKDRLIDEVWGGAIIEENAIQAQVSALRKALGDEAGRLITVHRRGYRLDLTSGECPAGDPPPVNSVAVLPFDNLSSDPANGYLADGIAEELLTTLSRIPELKVSARTSSFAYRGKQVDARQIGRDLAVVRLIEGSVRVAGNRVRVTVQLIDTASGAHLWARNFDREMTDFFALQDDIARAIAVALETELTGGGPPTRDLEAYQMYLQARALLDRWDRPSVPVGMALFRRALEKDPSFTPAAIGLATIMIGASVDGLLPLSVREEALILGQRAAREEPDAGMPQSILGCLAALRGDWTGAAERYDAAIALTPDEPYIHFSQSFYLLAPCGHLARAQVAAERAFLLAPAVALFNLARAVTAGLRGEGAKHAQCLAMAETLGMSREEPALLMSLAARALRSGDWMEAAECVSAGLPAEIRIEGLTAARQVFRAIMGLEEHTAASESARRLLAASESEALRSHSHLAFGVIAGWQVMLGNLDAAFEALSRLADAWRADGHLATLSLMTLWSFHMRPLRSDPRFSDFARELGMFTYWARYGAPDGHEIRDGRLIVV